MANAWWSGDAAELLASEPETIVQRLAVRLVETHYLNRDTQLHAWRQQIVLLRTALRNCPGTWRVLFEYPLLRLGRRIDVVLLTAHAILVLEFKVGATSITTIDRQQTEDYALDLFDFHAESRAHPVVPILVATAGSPCCPGVAAALAWCDAGVRSVGDIPRATATAYRRACPNGDAGARCPGMGNGRRIDRCRRSLKPPRCCTIDTALPTLPRPAPMSAIWGGPPMRSDAQSKRHALICSMRFCSSPAYRVPARHCAG